VKKAFLDSDIILDALLKRPGFELQAINLMAQAQVGNVEAVTSSIAFMNVHYFLDKFDRPRKMHLLSVLRSIVSIIEVGEDTIDLALNSNFSDFEDAVQYYAAVSAKADVIITRNIKDYKHSSIPVLTAEQFLKTL
jgi:predicted nucleic acid-binding protein